MSNRVSSPALLVSLTTLSALLVVSALSTSPLNLAAQDEEIETSWRQWGGPNGNFIIDSPPLADSWSTSGPPELWNRQLGAGHSAILADRGRLFTMYRVAHGPGGSGPFDPEESVVAMDAVTGETLWEHTYPSKVQDFGQGAGPHSTPLLIGGRLFTIGTNKELFALDPESGTVLWSRNLIEDFDAPPLLIRSMIKPGYGGSPLAYKDTIIIQVGGPGQSVMALRQSDGTVVWRSGSFMVSHSPAGLISVDGSPHIVIFAGQAVHGLDPDTGDILWAHAHDAGNDFNFQVPMWGEDSVLFMSSGYIGGSRAIKLTRHRDVTTTDELWYDPNLRFTFLNPLRLGDFVYGTSGQSTAAIMTATHVTTGETAWRARGFSRANMLYADGKAFVLQEDGTLSMVTLTPSGMTILAETVLFNTTSWTVPTLVDHTLYARDRERIVALDLRVRE